MFNVLALHPNMAQQILEELRVEPILAELQQQKRVATTAGTSSVRALSTSDEGDLAARASMITTSTNFGEDMEKPVLVNQKKSKTELWNELKIMSILILVEVTNFRSCENFDFVIFVICSCSVIENTVQFIRKTGLCGINSCFSTRVKNGIFTGYTTNTVTGGNRIWRFRITEKFLEFQLVDCPSWMENYNV
jgi:Peroxin-3